MRDTSPTKTPDDNIHFVNTKTVDISKAVALRFNRNMSYDNIAKVMGHSKSTIHKVLAPFGKLVENPKACRAYADNRSAFLNSAECQVVSKMVDDDKLEKATIGNLGYVLEKLTNARRLQDDQATSNLAVVHESRQQIEESTKNIKALQEELRELAGIDA